MMMIIIIWSSKPILSPLSFLPPYHICNFSWFYLKYIFNWDLLSEEEKSRLVQSLLSLISRHDLRDSPSPPLLTIGLPANESECGQESQSASQREGTDSSFYLQ